jgi:DNA-directed RNA polymerase specialized sigma24 family protein
VKRPGYLAEDAAQDAAVAVLSGSATSVPAVYLRTIDARRSWTHEQSRAQQAPLDVGAFATEDPSPEDLAGRAELRAFVAMLRGPLRDVIEGHYLQGRPFQDVAAARRCSPTRVAQLHQEALRQLRALLLARGRS